MPTFDPTTTAAKAVIARLKQDHKAALAKSEREKAETNQQFYLGVANGLLVSIRAFEHELDLA